MLCVCGMHLLMLPKTYSDQSVLGLELHRFTRVVDEGKTGRTSTTECGAHAEDDTLLLGCLVHGSELLAKLGARDIGSRWVDDIQNHLLPLQETVGDELTRSKRDGRRSVL